MRMDQRMMQVFQSDGKPFQNPTSMMEELKNKSLKLKVNKRLRKQNFKCKQTRCVKSKIKNPLVLKTSFQTNLLMPKQTKQKFKQD